MDIMASWVECKNPSVCGVSRHRAGTRSAVLCANKSSSSSGGAQSGSQSMARMDFQGRENALTPEDKEFAKDTDKTLSEMMIEIYEKERQLGFSETTVMYSSGAEKIYTGRSANSYKWNKSLDEALQYLDDHADDDVRRRPGVKMRSVRESYDERLDDLRQAQREMEEFEDENYTGWQRFYLVSDGHIHESRMCSSLRPSTRLSWLPDLAGESEAEAVEQHGAMLCTKCFPSAPVEWTNGDEKKEEGLCPGSGSSMDLSLPHRKGYAAGNWAQCKECGEKVTISKNWNLRKHKVK